MIRKATMIFLLIAKLLKLALIAGPFRLHVDLQMATGTINHIDDLCVHVQLGVTKLRITIG